MVTNTGPYVVGIDIGGTNFRAGMLGDGELFNFTMQSSRNFKDCENPLDDLRDMIERYIDSCAMYPPSAIAIGFPSTVSKDKRIVYTTPNLPGFTDLDIAGPLEDIFGVPVIVDRDVNFLLQYEISRQQLLCYDIITGIYIGTGIGNSVYMNGQIFTGKNGIAFELGHIPVPGKSDLCGCGRRGCIELYASGKRLEEICKEYFPDTRLNDIFLRHTRHAVLQEYIEALATPIITEIILLDPDCVVLGGGVIHMQGFPKETLETKINSSISCTHPNRDIRFHYAHESQEAGVLGAAMQAYKRFVKTSSNIILEKIK